MAKGQKWVLNKEYSGAPTTENFKLVEFDLPEQLKENEVLTKALYLTVDPYMRLFGYEVGKTMNGEQVAEVIKSNNTKFPVGSIVLSSAGWTSHSVSNGEDIRNVPFDTTKVSKSLALGTLGMPGSTAFIGLNMCFPKKGETVLVSSSASAVGNVVGQLAKIKGCTVIGTTGSEEKVQWCKELGYDHVINYKTENFSDAISRVAPQGIDVYFDNVGGDYFTTIINKHMNKFGRILVCGSISTYNDVTPKTYPAVNSSILSKMLTVKGIMVFECASEIPAALTEMSGYIQDGRLKYKETVYESFEKMVPAFIDIFSGENIGKTVVKTNL